MFDFIKKNKQINYIFLLSTLIVFAWFPLKYLIPLEIDAPYKGESGMLNVFTAYDSEHYMSISSQGYTHDVLYAFFPLYPFLIHILSYLGIPNVWGAVLISFTLRYLSFYLFASLTEEENKAKILWIWGLSPIVIFIMSVYTESLFVFLTLFAWLLFKKEKFLWSAVFIGLSILTRNVGVILFAILILSMLINKRKLKEIFSFVFTGSIIASIYPIYSYFTTGSLLKFVSVQNLFGRASGNPFEALFLDFMRLISLHPFSLAIFFNLLAFALAMFLGIKFFKKHWELATFLICGAFISLFAPVVAEGFPSTTSLVRYVFGLFPIYYFLSLFSYQNKRLRFYLMSAYLFCMATITLLFILKKFIA